MKKLSTAFEIVAWLGLSISVICAVIFAVNAESDAVLVFLYWMVGGGLFYLFMLAYSYFLDVASDIKDRLKKESSENQPTVNFPDIAKKIVPVMPAMEDGYLICPSCGSRQRSGASCLTCGVEFIKTKQ